MVGFHRKGHKDIIVNRDVRSGNQGGSVKNISGRCGSQDSLLDELRFNLTIVVSTVEETEIFFKIGQNMQNSGISISIVR